MSTIRSILDLPPSTGEVGIEIELEGRNLPKLGLPDFWHSERDGSLRGEDNTEYVLDAPELREDVYHRLSHLSAYLSDSGAEIDLSPRTSVHVHINFQEQTLQEVLVMTMLYYMAEEALFKFVAPHRKGNFYCLSIQEASSPLETIERMSQGRLDIGNLDRLRYGALNLAALWKYGSLEFRALEGTMDVEKIDNWVGMLLSLKDLACEIGTLEELSRIGIWNIRAMLPSRIRRLMVDTPPEVFTEVAAPLFTIAALVERETEEELPNVFPTMTLDTLAQPAAEIDRDSNPAPERTTNIFATRAFEVLGEWI